jgi:hypothetical protein
MGLTPQQFNAMSPWQWEAMFEGWYVANVPEDQRAPEMMTPERVAAATMAYDTYPDTLTD